MNDHGGIGRSYDPHDHAHALGLVVVESLLPRGQWGAYRPVERTIALTPGLTRREARCVVAHEVAHALRGDGHGQRWPGCAKAERQAQVMAALRLVCPIEYAAAERLHGPHPAALAIELDVIPEVIADWRIAFRSRMSA